MQWVGVGDEVGLGEAGGGEEGFDLGGGVGAALGCADWRQGVLRVPLFAGQEGEDHPAAGTQDAGRWSRAMPAPM